MWYKERERIRQRQEEEVRRRFTLAFDFFLIRALPLKEEGLRHSVESVVRGMELLFSALPFEFALRKVTIISDKATEGNDFTLVRQGIGVAVTGLSLAGIDRKREQLVEEFDLLVYPILYTIIGS